MVGNKERGSSHVLRFSSWALAGEGEEEEEKTFCTRREWCVMDLLLQGGLLGWCFSEIGIVWW